MPGRVKALEVEDILSPPRWKGEECSEKMERWQNFPSLTSRSKEKINETVRAALVYSYFWIYFWHLVYSDYYAGM